MSGTPRCRILDLRMGRKRVNPPALPEVPESLEEIDRMAPRLLVERVDGRRQTLTRRMVSVLARVVFERLPRRFLRVLLGRVLRKPDHSDPRLALEILLDLFIGQVRRRVEPDQQHPARAR